tara:strand:- start:46 stop:252 length:207 start_codon:yes stop_codon:yes gene_type:complete
MGDELSCIAELLCCCILLEDCETSRNNNNNINNRNEQFVNGNSRDVPITIVQGVPLLKNRIGNKIERD